MSLIQKNGVWYFRKMIKGVRFDESLKTSNEREAQKRASNIESEAWSGERTRKTTFGEWWKEFQENYLPRYKAQRDFDRVVAQVLPNWKHRALHGLRANECQAYLTRRMNEGIAPVTAGLERRLLKIIFEAAVQAGRIPRNPWDFKTTGLTGVKRLRVLSTTEQSLLFAECSSKKTRIFQFMLLTGLRSAELRAMKPSHIVQLPSPGLRVVGKGMKLRVVPLVPKALELFPRVLQDLVYRKKVLTRKALLQALQVAVERANAKGASMEVLTLHDLRRTFATRCIEAGMPLAELSVILGHASVSTTAGFYVALPQAHTYAALVKALGGESLVSGENSISK